MGLKKVENGPRSSTNCRHVQSFKFASMLSFILLGFYLSIGYLPRINAWENVDHGRRSTTNETSSGLLDVFQVDVPLRSSFSGTSCEQVIVDHEFASSFGAPYVGAYSPPQNCDFNIVILNISVVSTGINYDRLGLLFLGDTEIWRTTTAMPTRTGIFYNSQKDVTIYDSLLRSEQKAIMQMDNLYDEVFTGTFNVTITALYYNDEYSSPLSPAKAILPLSKLSSSENISSAFTLPDDNATLSYTLPRNAERVVVDILASGNGDDEFWFRSVPSEFEKTFPNKTLRPYSPFREVQLLIDGQLAGVSWPFPVVFTGGINPALWVPIVGIHTYDVPSYQVDISPWLGILCDGNPHSFTLTMAGYDSTTLLGSVNQNWIVSGSIFVWVDEAGNQTTGSALVSSTPPPKFNMTSNITTSSETNTSLAFQLYGQRSLSHSATITTSSGEQALSWTQDLSYSNVQNWTAVGANGTVNLYQETNGSSTFSAYGLPDSTEDRNNTSITNMFRYPISFIQTVGVPINDQVSNSSLHGTIDRSLLSNSTPVLSYLTLPSVFRLYQQQLETRQSGYAVEYWNDTYYQNAGAIDPAEGSAGQTEQWYSYSGPVSDGSGDVVGFGRYVKAYDGYEPALLVNETYPHVIAVPSTTPLSLPRS